MKNAAVYFRCSTGKQDKSVGDQRQVIVGYAEQHGLRITAWFDQDEGKSGTSFEKRSDFMRMVKMVESGKHDFGCILVYDVDRWGRPIDPEESGYWDYHFKRYGVRVIYVSDESVNQDSMAGRLTKTIKQELATEESRKQSIRVRERSKMRAAEGFRVGGFAPYGYKRLLMSSDGTPIRVLEHGERKAEKSERVMLTRGDPDEIELVRRIFKMKAAGSSIREIVEWLNSNGIPAPSAKMPTYTRNTPGKWGLNGIQKMLCNRVYRGDLVYNKQVRGSWAKFEAPGVNWREKKELVVCPNACEPLVDMDTFDKAQSTRSRRGTPRKGRSWKESPYLLTGLIYCANCGYKHHGHVHRRNGSSYHYYEDSGFNLHGKSVCSQSMIPKEGLEQFVLEQVCDRVLPAINMKTLRREIAARLNPPNPKKRLSTGIQTKIAAVERKLENIKNSIENGIDPTFIGDRIDQLRAEKASLGAELQVSLQTAKPQQSDDELVAKISQLAKSMPTILASSEPKKVKPALRHFVDRIEVDAKKRIARCFFYRIPKPDTQDKVFTGNVLPEVGLEPTWYCYRGILSPLRLPVSPLRQAEIRKPFQPGKDCFQVGQNITADNLSSQVLVESVPRTSRALEMNSPRARILRERLVLRPVGDVQPSGRMQRAGRRGIVAFDENLVPNFKTAVGSNLSGLETNVGVDDAIGFLELHYLQRVVSRYHELGPDRQTVLTAVLSAAK